MRWLARSSLAGPPLGRRRPWVIALRTPALLWPGARPAGRTCCVAPGPSDVRPPLGSLTRMTSFRAEDRIDPPTASDEAATLLGFLNYQRDTLRWKCTGLTTLQLSTPVAPTTLTLGGLLKHLAVVEAGWLNQFFGGGVAKPSWFEELDQNDPDWSLTSATGTTPEQLFAWFDESIAVSDQVIADALDGPHGLAALSEGRDDGKRISLRWIVCHLIEEYARHNGHADLIRESIDGATGE